MIKVAIVILNWNGKNYLEKFLPSVIKYSDYAGAQIFIADNGSTDESVNWISEYHPEVNLIRLDINYGYALGYVKALDLIEAQYFVLLNSDVEITSSWLNPLIDMMDNDQEIGACMPKMLSYADREYFEYAGAAGGFIDKFGYPFCRGRILNVIEKDNHQFDDECEIFWASGACMILRSAAYYDAGGLDGDFFAHMEEIDLCWRLKKKGYKIKYNPNVYVYHLGGGTLPNNNPRKLYYNYRNSLFLLFKNLPDSLFFQIMTIRILLDIASAFIYLKNGEVRFCFAVIKAHCNFYCHFISLIKKRYRIQQGIKNFSVSRIYPHSILKDFFIRKKRYFKQLEF